MLKKLLLSTALGVCVSQTPVHAWDYFAHTDKMNDNVRYIVYTKSTDYRARKAELAIICAEERSETNLFIDFPGLWVKDYGGAWPSDKIIYRLDKDIPQKINFGHIPEKGIMFLPVDWGLFEFIENMFDRDTLVIDIEYEKGMLYEFDISGLREAIKPIREACNW